MTDMLPQPDARDEDRYARGAGDAVRLPTGEWHVGVDFDEEDAFAVTGRDLFRVVAVVNRKLELMAWRALDGR